MKKKVIIGITAGVAAVAAAVVIFINVLPRSSDAAAMAAQLAEEEGSADNQVFQAAAEIGEWIQESRMAELTMLEQSAAQSSEAAARAEEEKREADDSQQETGMADDLDQADGYAQRQARILEEEAQIKAAAASRAEAANARAKEEEESGEAFYYSFSNNRSLGSTSSVSVKNVPLDEKLIDYIIETSESNGVDSSIVFSVIYRESSFNSRAVSAKGSIGLMQVHPSYNAARLKRLGITNLYDPYQNVKAGIDYLAEYLEKYNGDYAKTLTAYRYGRPNASQDYAERVFSSVDMFR